MTLLATISSVYGHQTRFERFERQVKNVAEPDRMRDLFPKRPPVRHQ